MNIPDAPWTTAESETRIPIKSASGRTVAYAAIGRQDYEVANLIAAAPDLLEALTEMARCHAKPSGPHCGNIVTGEMRASANEAAFSAIARAKGT